MPCHPHTARQRLWPFIRTPTSVSNLDNPRQRRTNPYGYPKYLRCPFDDSRGPSRPFAVLRGPSIPLEIPRDPSRSFDPSLIPFGGLRAYIAPSLRPRTIPQYLGHRPLSRRFPMAGFRPILSSFVMLVRAVSSIGCIGMQGEPHSSALTVTGPIFGLVTLGSLDK